jgi:hypothetical protein
MEKVIQAYLGEIKIGSKQSYKNLAMFPLVSSNIVEADYLMLDEALQLNLIEIAEVDHGGSVPDLKVVNKSEKMLLLLDGEELVGAKQNRIINTTILIAANSSTVIPVSCVEQGRWSYNSSKFSSHQRFMSPDMRAKKAEQVNYSVRMTGEFRSNQGLIWDDIFSKAKRMDAESSSMAMAEIYEKKTGSIEDYSKNFTLAGSQAGALFMINGKVSGLDSFGKPDTLSKVFKKLVESYALDAIDWYDPEKEISGEESMAAIFIEKVNSAVPEAHRSVALGKDIRLESTALTGFALEHNNEILHLCAFAKENSAGNINYSSRIDRFSRRRMNRL